MRNKCCDVIPARGPDKSVSAALPVAGVEQASGNTEVGELDRAAAAE